MHSPRVALILLAVITACGGATTAPEHMPPRTSIEPNAQNQQALQRSPEGLRLPRSPRPLGYQLALDVDPSKETFGGRVVIDVELDKATHPLWLNATNLTIDSARILAADPGAERPLRVVDGARDVIGLATDAPMGPGRVQIEIAYRGVQNDRQSDGIIRHQDAGDWYLVTDLQPLGARRVVPCFDEPGFKVPWQLELTTPANLLAASNAPVEAEEPLPDGRRRTRFAATPPMPSYLFAFAVGPFDVVDAGATRKGVPMRVLVPRGRGADAAFMAGESGRMVAALEDYTGIDFPYAKLDHVVTPGGLGGAMENVGLITYAPSLLLLSESTSPDARQTALRFMAHEIAHQWFGNLVTLAWWDDLWLNEAFATWASHRLMHELYASYGGELSAPRSRYRALAGESDPAVRAIRQPVIEEADVARAFDSITYEKGATILHMLDDALGQDVMRTGIRAYLDRHRWGNARTSDFIAALSAAAGRDLAPWLETWLDRAGAPLVSVSLACPAGQPAGIELSQRRMPVSTDRSDPETTTWHMPVCVRVVGERAARCTELSERTGRIELGDRCPSMVVPSGRGHYRTELSPSLRAAVVRSYGRLTTAEQAAFVSDTAALVDADLLDVGAMLDLFPAIGTAPNQIAIFAAMSTIESSGAALPDRFRPAFQKFVAKSFGRLARATGWDARPGEPDYATATRRLLVPAVTVHTRDARLQKAAHALAMRWTTDHAAVPVDRWWSVLSTGIAVDDGRLIERLNSAIRTEPDAVARAVVASALGYTRDPERLRQMLEHVLAQEPLRPELLWVLYGPDTEALETVRLAFLEEHLPDLLGRVAADSRARLAPSTCVAAHRARVVALLDTHFVALPAFGQSGRDRAIARMDACIVKRENLMRRLGDYFSTRAKAKVER